MDAALRGLDSDPERARARDDELHALGGHARHGRELDAPLRAGDRLKLPVSERYESPPPEPAEGDDA